MLSEVVNLDRYNNSHTFSENLLEKPSLYRASHHSAVVGGSMREKMSWCAGATEIQRQLRGEGLLARNYSK